jgi:NADH-quinone oxidoreductase subunit G
VREGPLRFRFHEASERLKLPLVRRNGKLEPSSWEDALAEVSRRLAEIHKAPARIRSDSSARTARRTKKIICWAHRARSIGTNNIDHHRTADYASLIAALGEQAGDASATMTQLYEADAVLLVGDDPTEQNPLVAWQIRSAIRHRGSRLYVINSKSIKLLRKAKEFAEVPEGGEAPPCAGSRVATRSSTPGRSSGLPP